MMNDVWSAESICVCNDVEVCCSHHCDGFEALPLFALLDELLMLLELSEDCGCGTKCVGAGRGGWPQ